MQDWTVLKHLSMDGTPHEQLVWKLSMVAVKRGLKPAFLYSEFKTMERGEAVSDRARRIGLLATLSSKRELMDLSPTEIARYTNREGAGIWIYRREDDSFSEKLTHYLQGRSKITQGTLLGYPPCCVSWYEQGVEIPQGLRYLSLLSEDDMTSISGARQAMSLPSYELSVRSTFAMVAVGSTGLREQLCLSMRAYPFVSHVACPSCIRDAKSRSARLNERLSALALSIDSSLRDSIIGRARAESDNMMASLREWKDE